MVAIITATRHPTLCGTYRCVDSKSKHLGRQDVGGAYAAAAWLLQAARNYSQYTIVAPEEVMAAIPEDCMNKR